ncbi:MAG: hypothetical protein VCA74_03965 [Deltaproteobacteria bacterium]
MTAGLQSNSGSGLVELLAVLVLVAVCATTVLTTTARLRSAVYLGTARRGLVLSFLEARRQAYLTGQSVALERQPDGSITVVGPGHSRRGRPGG